MSSRPGSIAQSGSRVRRVAVVTHGKPETIGPTLSRLEELAGEYRVEELPTLEARVEGERRPAVNDVVVTSGTVGRMVELVWSIGDEDLGRQACDGLICSTPSGSTAYNLSNGGPVLVWGLDAM